MSEAPSQSPLATPEPWNLVADDYSHELLPMFKLFSSDALALSGAARNAKILDVAAGPGTLSLLAARAGAKVSAIDFSPQMLENMKRRFGDAHLTADTRLGDGQALPFEAGEFTAAFSMFGLMFFPDRARGFAELFRVLKPKGVCVVSSWAPLEGIFKDMMGAVREALPDVPFGDGKGPLGDPAEFAEELKAAGFDDVNVVQRTHTLKANSPAAMWAQAQRTTAPLVLLKQRSGDEKWAEVTAGVLERLQVGYGTGTVEITTTAHLGFGRKP